MLLPSHLQPRQRAYTAQNRRSSCSSCRSISSWTKPTGRARQRLQPVASSYTQEAMAAVRLAQQEAIRQGSMFVAPPHLLLGLLDVKPPCKARQLLEDAGLTAAAAEKALIDNELIPKGRIMSPGDLDFAPDARLALKLAAEAAAEADLSAAGTPHLLLGVVTCSNRIVTKLLEQAGISATVFAVQIRKAAKDFSESAAGQPASAEEQKADLIAHYQRYVQQHGTAPPEGGATAGMRAGSSAGAAMTPDDDDIYN